MIPTRFHHYVVAQEIMVYLGKARYVTLCYGHMILNTSTTLTGAGDDREGLK